MPDTENIRGLVNTYDSEVQRIADDKDLKDEAKARRILELNDKVLEDFGKAHKAVTDGFDAERAALEAKIGSARASGPKDTQTELRAMRSELAARDVLDGGRAGAIFEGYQQAAKDGDEAAAEVFERRGPGTLTALGIPLSEVQRFEDMVRRSKEARMSPEERQAREELAALDKRRDSAEMALLMQRDTLLNRVRTRNVFYGGV